MGRPAFGTHGVALAGGTRLALLAVRRQRDADGNDVIDMTHPIDDLELSALPVPRRTTQGSGGTGQLLAGACMLVDGWNVPRQCRGRVRPEGGLPPAPCLAPLPFPIRPGLITCPRCGVGYPARRRRQLVMVSRYYLTILELASPTGGASGGDDGR